VKWVLLQKDKHPELSITARSAGTDMSGGAINNSIIADFTAHFNAWKCSGPTSLKLSTVAKALADKSSDKPAGGFAVVEPGFYYRDFENKAF